jgi:hypothetical protein
MRPRPPNLSEASRAAISWVASLPDAEPPSDAEPSSEVEPGSPFDSEVACPHLAAAIKSITNSAITPDDLFPADTKLLLLKDLPKRGRDLALQPYYDQLSLMIIICSKHEVKLL